VRFCTYIVSRFRTDCVARNPTIAASVESVTHRCHLTPPDIFNELPHRPFTAQTLSVDPRTICLVRLAVRNMTRVNTLRVVFGHPKLTEALLRCFFDADRQAENRVKRLWLDNIDIVAGTEQTSTFEKNGLPLHLDFRGVEALRLRRLPLGAANMEDQHRLTRRTQVVYSRGGRASELSDGLGGNYLTTTNFAGAEIVPGLEQAESDGQDLDDSQQSSPLETLMRSTNRFDDAIYEALSQQHEFPPEVVAANIPSHCKRSLHMYMDRWALPVDQNPEQNHAFTQLFRTETPSPAACANLMLTDMAKTLVSLNIDWAIKAPQVNIQAVGGFKSADYVRWIKWFSDLFSLRFPHLRAFQYRNAVTAHTTLPPGLYLLDKSTVFFGHPSAKEANLEEANSHHNFFLGLKPLEFMEAHADKLNCLAWPMAQFFSDEHRPDIATRARSVIEKLSRSLVDLRVDEWYFRHPETNSEEGVVLFPDRKRSESFFRPSLTFTIADLFKKAHLSRRRFIAEFAAEMRVLRSIKVEGGIPRDERRETIAALRHCPIEKLVFIGIGSIIGNTWGPGGEYYGEEMSWEDTTSLEEVDEGAIRRLGMTSPSHVPAESSFVPSYGWRGREPMLHTIVSRHGESLRELKMCGYKGAIALYDPSFIVWPMLAALKHCHALESLMMSFWLPTLFENNLRDAEVISYWLDQRDSTSTGLVCLSAEPPAEGSWPYELETKFKPAAVAARVANLLGNSLSSTAKRRPGGLHVRASFSMQEAAIFDLDLWLGENSDGGVELIRWEGPSDETEPRRRDQKLKSRRWF
jgi:hypothetical protein